MLPPKPDRVGWHSPVPPPFFAGPDQLVLAAAPTSPASPAPALAPPSGAAVLGCLQPRALVLPLAARQPAASRPKSAAGDLTRRNLALRHASHAELRQQALLRGASAELPAARASDGGVDAAAAPPGAGLGGASADADPADALDAAHHGVRAPVPAASARARAASSASTGLSAAPPTAAVASADEAAAAPRAAREARSLGLLAGASPPGASSAAPVAGGATSAPELARRGSHTLLPFAPTLESLDARLGADSAARTPASAEAWPRPRALSLGVSGANPAAATRRSRAASLDADAGANALRRGARAPLPSATLFASLAPSPLAPSPSHALSAPLAASTAVTAHGGEQLGERMLRRRSTSTMMRHLPRLSEDDVVTDAAATV